MQRSVRRLSCLLAFGSVAHALKVEANPIRKVVSLLEAMQQKVVEDGKTEKALFEKFECYCSKGADSLKSSIEAANVATPALAADIKSGEEQSAQLKGELKQAQVDRDAAKAAIAEATALRQKQAAAYASEKADYEANIAAVGKAVAALERGASGAFLQTPAAALLQKVAFGREDMLDADRQELASFLSGQNSEAYAPQGGQITGILKGLGDSMSKSLADITATEQASIASFEALVKAKKAEIEALTEAVETKTQRVGELGVSIVQWQNDLSATEKALVKDQEFLENLQSSCSTKAAEFKEREQTRGEELTALAETIKLLNDDDALDLFKNTLPAGASFVQLQASNAAVRAQALAVLEGAQKDRSSLLLDRLVLVLRGKKIGFEKVVTMIDGMVQLLKKEQQDDDHKKEFCNGQFDIADDKKKALERQISDAEKAIDDTELTLQKITEEIAALQAGLKALDKSVAEATEQRKKENAEYQELLSSNNAAKDLLNLAKNRLNKFYNPKLHKAEAAAALIQISAHVQHREDPGAAPETFSGPYAKKSEESTGVIHMIDLLIQDLDKELQEAGVDEKNSQKAYEKLMVDSAAKRAEDSKLLTEKESTKGSLEGTLQSHKDAHASAVNELGGVEGYIASLHAECDWLLQYFDQRKEAREGEVDSLEKAKAVLSGASYSLVQTARSLRGAQ